MDLSSSLRLVSGRICFVVVHIAILMGFSDFGHGSNEEFAPSSIKQDSVYRDSVYRDSVYRDRRQKSPCSRRWWIPN